jgi:MOSC domain-containing protein YiiM
MVHGVQVGGVGPLRAGGRTVESGFVKHAATGPVWVDGDGLAGDEQADLRVHGGADKAVCVYPGEHYPYWSARLGRALPPAAFGENLTTSGLLETDRRIGDVLALGEVRLQVSQPRRTCYKLAARHHRPQLAREVQESGRTGFYCRVLHPGWLHAGQFVELIASGPAEGSVAEVNRVMNVDRDDPDGVTRLLGVAGLPERWRATLQARLNGRLEDDRARLDGPTPTPGAP